jgi:hypothetical protein
MLVALVALLSIGAPRAVAQDLDGDPERVAFAQRHFERGMTLYDARDFEGALASFTASFDLVPSPNSRLYVARSLRELGRVTEAVVVYEEVVRLARVRSASEERFRETERAAAAELTALSSRVGHVLVELERGIDRASVTLNGTALPEGAVGLPWPVAPGEVIVEARTSDGRTVRERASVEAGAEARVRLAIAPVVERERAIEGPVEGPVELVEPADGGGSPWPALAVVSGSIGVAGWGLYAGFGLYASSLHDDLETSCGVATCPPALQDDIDTAETMQLLANIGFGVAVGATAAAIVWLVLALAD